MVGESFSSFIFSNTEEAAGFLAPPECAEAFAFDDLGAHSIQQLRNQRTRYAADHINDDRSFLRVVTAAANGRTW
jgi:hypothetical protein